MDDVDDDEFTFITCEKCKNEQTYNWTMRMSDGKKYCNHCLYEMSNANKQDIRPSLYFGAELPDHLVEEEYRAWKNRRLGK